VGDIDFKVIFATENSNKFQKTRFWKEKSVENMVTLEGLLFNSSMISFHIWMFKKSIHTLQNNVHMLSFPIL
jgi:cell division protein FtsB